MATMASERSWLFDPKLLKLVHQCRRLIQSEFGVRLHLTEEHLEQRLASYAEQSRSEHLSRAWTALKEQVPDLGTMEKQDSADRKYRGRALTDSKDGNGQPDEEAPGGSGPARKTKVIYRGQVVG
ncbi:hypothetical protein SAMN05216203_3346 [Marinobacter daqiaonensis]|uniref:Uncharacterized protein n=1 Tax=Marinobacter daqiaonensis TaxID=650891 RepID=A0A1I6JV48_9GAMM|nr:hypothetical protein [Marinobacter daqiaonensis]SFR82875.1 hypothetical protein SAMN05216203_3346 [Marinobacter daqiaonensis]